jgi:hypothetical protein
MLRHLHSRHALAVGESRRQSQVALLHAPLWPPQFGAPTHWKPDGLPFAGQFVLVIMPAEVPPAPGAP